MRGPVCVLASLACAVALGCTSPKEGAAEPSAVTVLINEWRVQAGCPEVTADERLNSAAQRHAADMRDNGVRDHTGSDGSSPQQRIEAADYKPAAATGEILFWGTGSLPAEQAVNAWMNSPPHREIIEDCRLTNIGVAVIEGAGHTFAVADFGRPA